jgi:ubiquinone/menaquinone biosynthesis C-methylase UbiE
MSEVDLEELARAYRFRPVSRAASERARGSAADALDPLMDIGGGNGSHAAVWAASGRQAVVVDLSKEMTKQAAARRNVGVVRGDAHNLPFRDSSVGLAYFHMSIHYGDWRATLDEAGRVVRGNGVIDIWTFSPRDIERSSLAHWFPTVAEIDVVRFPSPVDLAAHLSTMGTEVVVSTSSERLERKAKDWIKGVRGRFVSTLQFVPLAELDAGIERFTEMYPGDDDIYLSYAHFTRVRCVV